jgi:hypothetical protein
MTTAAGRVLVVGEFGPGALGLAYARAFESLGWSVVRYDMWRGYTRGGVLAHARLLRRALRPVLWARMAREAVALARRAPLDLVVSTKAPFLGPGAVQALRRLAPAAMIYPDSPYGAYAQRPDVVAVLAEFDRVYIWSRPLLARLHADGVAAARYLPFAHDPMDYAAQGPIARAGCGRRHAIAFIGQRYDKRAVWLRALRGLDVGVWGLGWADDDVPGACVHREGAHGPAAAAIYRGATLALNVLHDDNLPAHNMRTFEIPPCRTAMLTEATADIAGFFEPGQACLAATTPEALRAEAERALADPGLAPSIAERGAQSAAPHTYAARARAILKDLVAGRRPLAQGVGR